MTCTRTVRDHPQTVTLVPTNSLPFCGECSSWAIGVLSNLPTRVRDAGADAGAGGACAAAVEGVGAKSAAATGLSNMAGNIA
jgi:hypothetical protein